MKDVGYKEEKTKKSRYKTARRFLIFWTIFVGLGAIWGAVCMFIDPSGKILQMDALLPYFEKLPFADILFRDYVFSGVALLIVNGITNITAATLLIADKKLGVILGGAFGVTLMLWICIQFYMFPLNVLSVAYFVFGFCQAVTGYAAYVFRKQENFSVDIAAYKNVGTDKTKLVVYFSRTGYVKKVAYERANETGADVYEIKATEKTSGTLGFWWCGRFGMHKWSMPIEDIRIDLSAYEEVTVCSPVWVFSFAAPVKSFLKECSGKIKKISYILVHFTDGKYKKAVEEADSLVGVEHGEFINIRCRVGKFKRIN